MIVVGLMTGTSADALDVAVADLGLREDEAATGSTAGDGPELALRLLDHREVAFPDDLADDILRLLEPRDVPLSLVSGVDARLGRFSADAVAAVLDETGVAADLVVSHGQTVRHDVSDGKVAGTLQIGQPAWIAERTGAPVLSDVRIRDITAGGHGAPLVSFLDALLLGERRRCCDELGDNLVDAPHCAAWIGRMNASRSAMRMRTARAPAWYAGSDPSAIRRSMVRRVTPMCLAASFGEMYAGKGACGGSGAGSVNAGTSCCVTMGNASSEVLTVVRPDPPRFLGGPPSSFEQPGPGPSELDSRQPEHQFRGFAPLWGPRGAEDGGARSGRSAAVTHWSESYGLLVVAGQEHLTYNASQTLRFWTNGGSTASSTPISCRTSARNRRRRR
jgi:hypothetical protein